MKGMRAIIVLLIAFVLTGLGFADFALRANLGSIAVYPNPFRAILGHSSITFDNLTRSVRIRIFKINGDLVFERDIETTDGKYVWNTLNNDGKSIATGIYVYVVNNNEGTQEVKTGKLVIQK